MQRTQTRKQQRGQRNHVRRENARSRACLSQSSQGRAPARPCFPLCSACHANLALRPALSVAEPLPLSTQRHHGSLGKMACIRLLGRALRGNRNCRCRSSLKRLYSPADFSHTGTRLFLPHFLGHGFGLIPAPGSFVASAFTVPHRKLPERTTTEFSGPSHKAAARFGSSSPRFYVPQENGAEKGEITCTSIQ